jgi:RNA polymerase primary sigma factor
VSAAAAPSRVPIHKHDRLAGELVRAYRAGDPDALERLILANEALVCKFVCRQLRGRGRDPRSDASFEDLMQAGRMGILKAADTYDWERASWATHAMWQILAHVGREFESDTIVSVPNNWHSVTHKAELARAIGCKAGAAPVGRDGEELTIKTQVVERRDHVAEVDRVDEAETWGDRVRVALRRLPERHREVLMGRYGLEGEPKTLDQVGDVLGVSREQVRQIEAKAERELRNQLRLSYGELLPEPGPEGPPRPHVEPRSVVPVRADVDPAEEEREPFARLAREEREQLAEARGLAREAINQERPMSTATSNGAAKSPSQGTCPECGSRLGGMYGNRCYQCKPAKGAGRPAASKVLDPIPKLPPPNPRPAPPAAVERGERLASVDVELEAMAQVLKAFRKLSPAGRRYVLENVERD